MRSAALLPLALHPCLALRGSSRELGGRLQIVVGLTHNPDDEAQPSMEPFFRFEGERGFFDARLTLNPDDPLGFSFDDGRIQGHHLGGGGRL